jgi:CRP-like cAMP-binding protein
MSQADRLDFLDALDPENRREILSRARVVRVHKGQTLLSFGEHSANVFIVTDGRLEVLLYSALGREVSFRDLGPGELLGELSAIDGEDRSVTIVATSEVRLLAISRADFMAVLRSSPQAAEWMLRRLTGRVRGLTEKVFELAAFNVQTRLHCELLRLARASSSIGCCEIDPAPTHRELANRIGTHREAITRELKMLSDSKIIRSGRRRMEVLNLDKLEHLVATACQRGADLMVDAS